MKSHGSSSNDRRCLVVLVVDREDERATNTRRWARSMVGPLIAGGLHREDVLVAGLALPRRRRDPTGGVVAMAAGRPGSPVQQEPATDDGQLEGSLGPRLTRFDAVRWLAGRLAAAGEGAQGLVVFAHTSGPEELRLAGCGFCPQTLQQVLPQRLVPRVGFVEARARAPRDGRFEPAAAGLRYHYDPRWGLLDSTSSSLQLVSGHDGLWTVDEQLAVRLEGMEEPLTVPASPSPALEVLGLYAFAILDVGGQPIGRAVFAPELMRFGPGAPDAFVGRKLEALGELQARWEHWEWADPDQAWPEHFSLQALPELDGAFPSGSWARFPWRDFEGPEVAEVQGVELPPGAALYRVWAEGLLPTYLVREPAGGSPERLTWYHAGWPEEGRLVAPHVVFTRVSDAPPWSFRRVQHERSA